MTVDKNLRGLYLTGVSNSTNQGALKMHNVTAQIDRLEAALAASAIFSVVFAVLILGGAV